MAVKDILKIEAVIADLKASDRCDAIKKLVERLTDSGILEAKYRKKMECEAIAREEMMPTGLEDGVAVPHAVVEGLDRQIGAFGRALHPIDFLALDGKPCDLIFLILIPNDKVVPYVKRMAELVKFFRNAANRKRIREAKSAEQIYEVFE